MKPRVFRAASFESTAAKRLNPKGPVARLDAEEALAAIESVAQGIADGLFNLDEAVSRLDNLATGRRSPRHPRGGSSLELLPPELRAVEDDDRTRPPSAFPRWLSGSPDSDPASSGLAMPEQRRERRPPAPSISLDLSPLGPVSAEPWDQPGPRQNNLEAWIRELADKTAAAVEEGLLRGLPGYTPPPPAARGPGNRSQGDDAAPSGAAAFVKRHMPHWVQAGPYWSTRGARNPNPGERPGNDRGAAPNATNRIRVNLAAPNYGPHHTFPDAELIFPRTGIGPGGKPPPDPYDP